MKKKKREQMEQKKKKKLYAWQLGKSGSHIGSRSQLAGNIRSGKPILPSLPSLSARTLWKKRRQRHFFFFLFFLWCGLLLLFSSAATYYYYPSWLNLWSVTKLFPSATVLVLSAHSFSPLTCHFLLSKTISLRTPTFSLLGFSDGGERRSY